jgi:AP-3 complex subunit mu
MQPLMVTEFLHRIKDVFVDYFGSCTVSTIKENFVIVYELLDELLDAGFPLVTEPNVLKELIRPSTIFRSISNTVTGVNHFYIKKGSINHIYHDSRAQKMH